MIAVIKIMILMAMLQIQMEARNTAAAVLLIQKRARIGQVLELSSNQRNKEKCHQRSHLVSMAQTLHGGNRLLRKRRK